MKISFFFIVANLVAWSTFGQTTNQAPNTLIIHELSDPDKLNPLTSTGALSRYIQYSLFSRLLMYNPETLELEPQLAVQKPIVKEIEEGTFKGGMSLTYEIHPEATWDNGEPITAHDYVFTIKALRNPKVHSAMLRPYFNFIQKIEIDAENPKKFTLFSKEKYFMAEETTGEYLSILPRYIYDPNGLMNDFTIEELAEPKNENSLKQNAKIIEFAEKFNSNKYSRELSFVVGSGPYQLTEWTTGQQIVLTRKKDWWGDKVKDRENLKAYPNKLIYRLIPNSNEAIQAFKEGKIDILRSVKPETFLELKADEKYANDFFATPAQFAYYYIGFNTKKAHFTDQRVRKAFAHLVDRDKILKDIYQNIGVVTNSPINPMKSYYNKDIKGVEYDLEKAKKLLAEAGWKDSNKNGILDKKIKGKRVEFRISYKYNRGNTIREKIGLLLKKAAKKVGVDIELVSAEWPVFLDDTQKRDFDLMCLAWVSSSGLNDMKQIWHTDSDTYEGSNRVGFGDAKSDKIIEQIRVTLDEEEREKLYMEIQQIIHDDYPYIFLHSPHERVIMSERIKNPSVSALRPNYNVRGLKLQK